MLALLALGAAPGGQTRFHRQKTSYPPDDTTLYWSGNEAVSGAAPAADGQGALGAAAAPRGNRPLGKGRACPTPAGGSAPSDRQCSYHPLMRDTTARRRAPMSLRRTDRQRALRGAAGSRASAPEHHHRTARQSRRAADAQRRTRREEDRGGLLAARVAAGRGDASIALLAPRGALSQACRGVLGEMHARMRACVPVPVQSGQAYRVFLRSAVW